MPIRVPLRSAFPWLICVLTTLHTGQAPAATITYDDLPWSPEWGSVGLYSSAGAVDTLQGNIDEPNGGVDELDQDSTILRDSSAQVSALAIAAPPGTGVDLGPDPYSGRARTDFGENHAAIQTTRHYEFSSESGDFFLEHRNFAEARSRWTDEWTFTSFGTVTLDLHWDAVLEVDPLCPVGPCGLVYPPGMDDATLQRWSVQYLAGVGIYDLDELEPYYEEDSDIEYLFPSLITSILIEQAGADPDDSALAPIDIDASLSFEPIAGHRYLVGSEVVLSGRFGGDIDALNTAFLERIVLAPGQALSSAAVANLGAQYEIVTSAPEPSSTWLILLALGGGLGLRRLGRSARR